MDAVRCFVFGALFLSSAVFAQAVLVERPPEYSAGEDSTIIFKTNWIVGPTTINVLTDSSVEKDGIRQTSFSFKVKKARFFGIEGMVLVEDNLRRIHLKFGETQYDITSTITFPLHEGDVFENVILKSKPCERDSTEMCLDPSVQETCGEVRLVAQGVSFVCRSRVKQVRYLVDKDFKWLIHFEKLDPE